MHNRKTTTTSRANIKNNIGLPCSKSLVRFSELCTPKNACSTLSKLRHIFILMLSTQYQICLKYTSLDVVQQ